MIFEISEAKVKLKLQNCCSLLIFVNYKMHYFPSLILFTILYYIFTILSLDTYICTFNPSSTV
jgi:hypothetical protein